MGNGGGEKGTVCRGMCEKKVKRQGNAAMRERGSQTRGKKLHDSKRGEEKMGGTDPMQGGKKKLKKTRRKKQVPDQREPGGDGNKGPKVKQYPHCGKEKRTSKKRPADESLRQGKSANGEKRRRTPPV